MLRTWMIFDSAPFCNVWFPQVEWTTQPLLVANSDACWLSPACMCLNYHNVYDSTDLHHMSKSLQGVHLHWLPCYQGTEKWQSRYFSALFYKTIDEKQCSETVSLALNNRINVWQKPSPLKQTRSTTVFLERYFRHNELNTQFSTEDSVSTVGGC